MTEPTESHSERSPLALGARDLVRAARHGVLSTLMPEEGYPYGSLVEILPLADGDLVLFLSQLAEHRHYLTADPRASVVIAPHIQEPRAMAQPRVTLVGRAEPIEDRDKYAEAYVRLHPTAASYINFPDFGFYRLRVDRVRYIAGFGQMGWIKSETYRAAFGHK
jgi:putative heme iron utilization protein